jgi:hypothetical protein
MVEYGTRARISASVMAVCRALAEEATQRVATTGHRGHGLALVED